MQHWPVYLAEVPATLLRLIAATSRISLPRRSDPDVRLARVRGALCRPAAVRTTYFALLPAEQAAAQALRATPRCLTPAAVAALLGPLRPLAELRGDRAPRSTAERFLLLGWLLPRPARRNHPAHYVVPPELRAWLPRPLPAAAGRPTTDDGRPTSDQRPATTEPRPPTTDDGRPTSDQRPATTNDGQPPPDDRRPALDPWPLTRVDGLRGCPAVVGGPSSVVPCPGLPVVGGPSSTVTGHGPPALPLALRAATAILTAAALAPVPLRHDGTLAIAALRQIRPLLADLPPETCDALCAWVAPLLRDLQLLAPHGAAAVPAPAAARFLAAPPVERLQLLRDAWVRAPHSELALLPPRASHHGLAWPCLRRRLVAWAEALPATGGPCAFDQLVAAFGPLADGFTHPYRSGVRPPWNQATARAIWVRALHGPLTWLNLGGATVAVLSPAVGADADAPPRPWAYGEPGALRVDSLHPGAELLALAPFASAITGDAAGLSIALTQPSVARAVGRGNDPARVRSALERQAGPAPEPWAAVLQPAGAVRLLPRTVVLVDDPAVLSIALKRRAVRRLVETVLAPGVALAAPGREEALAKQLARHGHPVTAEGTAAAPAPPPTDLTTAEVASLLVASAHYRSVAPPDAPSAPHDGVIDRLRATLPPALGAATDAAIAALLAPPAPPRVAPLAAPGTPLGPAPSTVELLWRLREAIRRRQAVTMHYQGADDPTPRERIVRPIALERHGAGWYLAAYCLAARAERCFRLDRVHALLADSPEPEAGHTPPAPPPTQTISPRTRRRSAPRVGFFGIPPAPPPGSPLVGVWLDDGDDELEHAGSPDMVCLQSTTSVRERAAPRGRRPARESDKIVGGLRGDLANAVDQNALRGSGVERVVAHAVGCPIDQRQHLAPDRRELRLAQPTLEDAVLHPRAVALKELHDLPAPLVLDDVVADEREHGFSDRR